VKQTLGIYQIGPWSREYNDIIMCMVLMSRPRLPPFPAAFRQGEIVCCLASTVLDSNRGVGAKFSNTGTLYSACEFVISVQNYKHPYVFSLNMGCCPVDYILNRLFVFHLCQCIFLNLITICLCIKGCKVNTFMLPTCGKLV
jgi:hypothetical protein